MAVSSAKLSYNGKGITQKLDYVQYILVDSNITYFPRWIKVENYHVVFNFNKLLAS